MYFLNNVISCPSYMSDVLRGGGDIPTAISISITPSPDRITIAVGKEV